MAEVLGQSEKGGGIVVLLVLLAVSGCAARQAKVSASGAVPPGVTRRPVLEASLGVAPPVGWKWQVQERAGPQATGTLRHTNSGLYYTLEGTHELVLGGTAQTFPMGQAVFVPAGMDHIHRMLRLGSSGRKFEIYFNPGDASRPSPSGVRLLHFSEKAMDVRPGLTYTIRVAEVIFIPGARRELTPNLPVINYVLEGTKTRRVGDQVFKHAPGEVIELPVGTPFVAANEGTTPMRFLEVELVPTPSPPSVPPR